MRAQADLRKHVGTTVTNRRTAAFSLLQLHHHDGRMTLHAKELLQNSFMAVSGALTD